MCVCARACVRVNVVCVCWFGVRVLVLGGFVDTDTRLILGACVRVCVCSGAIPTATRLQRMGLETRDQRGSCG